MKRLLLLALSLFLILFVLCSCHGEYRAQNEIGSYDTTDYTVPESFDYSKQYEISFWAKSDSNATQTEIYKKAIADFEALYPNIKVNLKIDNDYGRIYQDVITNIQTNTTPNICITYPDHVATYLTGVGVVAPLDNLINDEKYGLGGSEVRFDAPKKEELIPKFVDECKINGRQYALPFVRSTEACYVNLSCLNALGYELPEALTWDFIWEVSEAALAKNPDGTYKANGQNVMIPFIYKSTDNMMIQMLSQKGAEYSTSEGDILLFNDTAKDILLEINSHAETGAFSTFGISSYPGDYLNRGQCVFAIDSTAGATWMGSDAPNMDIKADAVASFETAVVEIPQFDTEDPKMISQGPSVCLFNKEDKGEVLASWLFMQYLLTNEVQIPYSQTEGYAPVTTKAQQSAEYIDYLSREGEDNDLYYDVKIQATKLLIRNTDNTFVTPVFNGSASVRNAAGQLIENVTRAPKRRINVGSVYIDGLYRETATLYRLDVELGKIPAFSITLLCVLAAVNLSIGGYFIYKKVKKSKK